MGSALDGVNLRKARLESGAFRQSTPDGRVVTYTMMPGLQSFADDLLDSNKVPAGAIVVLEVSTGRVLALSQTRHRRDAARSPNVAFDATPPAASLFKIVTASALLERTDVRISTETCYRGGSDELRLEHLADGPREQSECTTLRAALGRSINAIIAKLADRRLDRSGLSLYAEKFWFNKDIPFDLATETSKADIPEDRLERARASAGFWHSSISPLHAAMIAQSLGDGGELLRPYIVERVEDGSGRLVYEARRRSLGRTVAKTTAEALVQAMTYTVTNGTAQRAFHDRKGLPLLGGVSVSGKTGTLNGDKPFRAYTWFAGVAPSDKPEIAIAALVVNQPSWRIKANTAAAEVLRRYFELTRSRNGKSRRAKVAR